MSIAHTEESRVLVTLFMAAGAFYWASWAVKSVSKKTKGQGDSKVANAGAGIAVAEEGAGKVRSDQIRSGQGYAVHSVDRYLIDTVFKPPLKPRPGIN